jgi:large subunit ribosomal protein L4
VGGGKAMGPKPRDYEYRPSRQVRRGGIKVALSLKAHDKKLVILEHFGLDQPKTKKAASVLGKLGLTNALVVEAKDNTAAHRALRNLAKFDVLAPSGINVESILRHDHLVLTLGAAKEIEGALAS